MAFGSGINKNKNTKGDYAESLIHNHFLKKGYEIFSPSGGQAHLFDGLVMRKKDSYIKTFLFDAKSKAARNVYKDTGIDLKHYFHYKEMSEYFGKNFLIFFIDEELGKIYYQNLNNYFGDFEKFKLYFDEEGLEYPRIENGKNGERYIYFSIETMVLLRDLSDEEIGILKEMSKNTNKNYIFNPVWDVEKIFTNNG